MILAMSLTFLTMLLLIVVVQYLVGKENQLIENGDQELADIEYQLPDDSKKVEVIIATALGAFLDQETGNYKEEHGPNPLQINLTSTWEKIGRQKQLYHDIPKKNL